MVDPGNRVGCYKVQNLIIRDKIDQPQCCNTVRNKTDASVTVMDSDIAHCVLKITTSNKDKRSLHSTIISKFT